MNGVEYLAFGKIDDMIAEYAALDMGKLWFKTYRLKYAMMPIGAEQYDTTFYETKAEGIADTKWLAKELGVKFVQL